MISSESKSTNVGPSKNVIGRMDARQQAANMEAYQRNFLQNNNNNTPAFYTAHQDTTYQVAPSEKNRAQNSAAQMIQEFKSSIPTQNSKVPSTFT